MVVSDHGFASFRRGMNYNTWLVKNGFMTLTGEDAKRKNLEDLFDQGNFFVNVDWSKTKAYALGLGQIYINQAGREAKGIVKPGEEYKTGRGADQGRARGLRRPRDRRAPGGPRLHPRRGLQRHLRSACSFPTSSPRTARATGSAGRTAWAASARRSSSPTCDIWSGDHCSVYPPLVKGILFSNVKLNAPNAYMGDVMPTILDLYKVKPTTNLDGKSLLVK